MLLNDLNLMATVFRARQDQTRPALENLCIDNGLTKATDGRILVEITEPPADKYPRFEGVKPTEKPLQRIQVSAVLLNRVTDFLAKFATGKLGRHDDKELPGVIIDIPADITKAIIFRVTNYKTGQKAYCMLMPQRPGVDLDKIEDEEKDNGPVEAKDSK